MFQALQCNANVSLPVSEIGTPCIICPNPDIAGVGVRAAFYIQSLFNTLLVILSPEDAAASAWAGALLTAALVIAAFVQKAASPPSLTLHHATLILNSLAIAPMLPVWKHPLPLSEARRARTLQSQESLAEGEDVVLARGLQENLTRKERRKTHNRQRAAITFALLSQVVFQWAWGLFLFVAPDYSQPACNQDTIVWILYFPLNAQNINEADYAIWPAWLLFCLSVTLYYAIALAVFSGERTHKGLSRVSTITSIASSMQSAHTPMPVQLYRVTMAAVPTWRDVRGQVFMWGNVVAVILWTSYIVISELQIQWNCIYSGENSFSGFGQITAAFLAFTPIWSIIVALCRLPGELRKAESARARGRARATEEQALLAHPDHGPEPEPEPEPEDSATSSWLATPRAVWHRMRSASPTLRQRAASRLRSRSQPRRANTDGVQYHELQELTPASPPVSLRAREIRATRQGSRSRLMITARRQMSPSNINARRKAVIEDIGETISEVSVGYFLSALVPKVRRGLSVSKTIEKLKAKGDITPDGYWAGTRLHVLIDALEVFNIIHGTGWIHRDISSGNVLAERLPDGTIVGKVADFEYATRFGDTESEPHEMRTTSPRKVYIPAKWGRSSRQESAVVQRRRRAADPETGY
ncbi:predicted protein [Postia placenta Mad-698-R]|nr:predicted protein [Postia placenta Mad-698-R]